MMKCMPVGRRCRRFVTIVCFAVSVPLMAPSLVQAQQAQGVAISGDDVAASRDAENPLANDDETARSDGRRTLGRFPINFGRGIIGVFSQDNLFAFLGGAAATTLAYQIDGGFVPGGNNAFNGFGKAFGDPLIVAATATGMFVAGRIVDDSTFRNMSYDVLLATGVNFLYTKGLKVAISRTRPDQSNEESFPSGHASNSFAWATVMDHHYGWRVGVPMYIVAGFVSVTRVDRGSHFFSDVVAGAALGYIVGRTITRANGKATDGPRLSVSPIVGPSGQRGLAVLIVY